MGNGSLTIHFIGCESEVDLLPVFRVRQNYIYIVSLYMFWLIDILVCQELEYLISEDIETINMVFVGPFISPYANNKTWLLSSRMRAEIFRGFYHDVVSSASGTMKHPDFIVCTSSFRSILFVAYEKRVWFISFTGFNAGLPAYASWKKTLLVIKVSAIIRLKKTEKIDDLWITGEISLSCCCVRHTHLWKTKAAP